MALRPIPQADLDWIPGSIPYDGRPTTVTRLLPTGFEAYVQVLHAIHVLPGRSPREVNSEHESTEARTRVDQILADAGASLKVEITSSRPRFGGSDAPTKVDQILADLHGSLPAGVASSRSRTNGSVDGREGQRVRWAELAATVGSTVGSPANFGRDLWDHIPGDWPYEFDGPCEGSLTGFECEALVRVLAPITSGEVTFYYGWFNTRAWAGRNDWGKLADLLDYFSMDDVEGSPEYWWPEDRAWLVHTDVDSCYTLVACAHDVADRLLNDPDLECLRLQPDDSLAGG